MRISSHMHYDKNCENIQVSQQREIEFIHNHSTICETVTMIQDTQVAKLWSNGHI
jgi:hypothetical protein